MTNLAKVRARRRGEAGRRMNHEAWALLTCEAHALMCTARAQVREAWEKLGRPPP